MIIHTQDLKLCSPECIERRRLSLRIDFDFHSHKKSNRNHLGNWTKTFFIFTLRELARWMQIDFEGELISSPTPHHHAFRFA